MITILIDADADRHTTDLAIAHVDGRAFRAYSRAGSIHAICRQFRDAGIPDQPWRVSDRIHGASIYWMADRYVAEDDAGIRTRRWNARAIPARKGQKGGAGPEGVGVE